MPFHNGYKALIKNVYQFEKIVFRRYWQNFER